jgi:hypothetical protein
MNDHPVDQVAAKHPAVAQRLLLAPVQCVDCVQHVPLGWVEYGTVPCAKNVGASGVVYGHRAPNYVITSVKDVLFNSLPEEVK